MKKNKHTKKAFTLIELLLAMSLSSFVIMGLMQSYHTLVGYLYRSRGIMITNRKTCLLFNQMERDFMTAFIPTIHKEIEPIKKARAKEQAGRKEPQKEVKKKTKKQEQEEEEKKRISYFMGEPEEGEFARFDGKRHELFKFATFITTNALQVYGQRRARFVRIRYELVQDKEKSQGENKSFILIRKETPNLDNVSMKVSEFEHDKEKQAEIREHVVADYIKGMYVEYITFKEEEKKDSKPQQKKEKEELRSFAWGEKEYSHGVVPERVELRVVFWNEDLSAEQPFHVIFPILSYPSEKLAKKKDGKDQKKDNAVQKVEKEQEQKKPEQKQAPVGGPQ